MFWLICTIAFIVAIVGGMLWGHEEFDSLVAGAFIWGAIAVGVLVVAFLLVAELGPKEGASSVDYAVEDVGGDMYYVDDGGSHKVGSSCAPRFGDVERATYRVTSYSWENWPAFPDGELLVPKEYAHGED